MTVVGMRMEGRLREGRGPYWGRLKGAARWLLHLHVPVNSFSRPLFCGLYVMHVSVRELAIWLLRLFWYEPLFRSQCRTVGKCFQMESLPYGIREASR